jgi:hypothetical protein
VICRVSLEDRGEGGRDIMVSNKIAIMMWKAPLTFQNYIFGTIIHHGKERKIFTVGDFSNLFFF